MRNPLRIHRLSKDIPGYYFFKTTVNGGTTLVGEMRPWDTGATLYVLNPFGGLHTTGRFEGAAHALEHMLFKSEKDARRIAAKKEFKHAGGSSNAGTTFYDTDFFARMPKGHLEVGMNYLKQLLRRPEQNEHQFRGEIEIISAEICRNHDHPCDYVQEPAFHTLYMPSSPTSILGTRESIRNFSMGDLNHFWESGYCPDNFLLGYVGATWPLNDLTKMFSDALSSLMANRMQCAPISPPRLSQQCIEFEEKRRGLEQAHIVVATHAPSSSDPFFPAFELLFDFLAGRDEHYLFQVIREANNMVYRIEGSLDFSPHHSMLPLYTGTERGNVKAVIKLIKDGFLCAANLSRKRFDYFKDESIGALKACEDLSENRAVDLARRELDGRGAMSLYHQRKTRGKVTLADFHRAAKVSGFGVTMISPA